MTAPKRDQFPDDEPDWIRSDRLNPKPWGSSGFALGGSILVTLLLMGVFVVWQHDQAERRKTQAQWEHDVAMQRAMEEAREAQERLELEAQLDKLNTTFAAGEMNAEDFRKALTLFDENRPRQMFLDGTHLLNEGNLDAAVEAFRQAAALDPRYAEHFEKALKLQAIRDRTAPTPREVKRP